MKKILYVLMPVFLFAILGLYAFADEDNTHYNTGYSQMTFTITQNPVTEHMPYVIVTGSQGQDITAYYDNYGVNTTVKVETTAHLLDSLSYQVHYEYYIWTRQNGVDGYYKQLEGNDMVYSLNMYSLQGGIVFKSKEAAIVYGNTGSVLPEDITNGEFPDPTINWGDNGDPEYGEPSSSIPAPQFNVSHYANGNIMKSVTFLNAEYDSRSQNGRYGIVMALKWSSIDEFTLQSKGLLSADYYVYYGRTLPFGNLSYVYSVPERESEINYCPQSVNFNQNTESLNAFNDYLTSYPVANRDISGGIENTFRSYLGMAKCPYNTLIFTCCYYKKNDNGTFEFGPYSTGTFYPPEQGAIFSAGTQGATSNTDGMSGGQGGGLNGQSDTPFGENGWNQNWGNGTNPNIDYGQSVDPQNLVNNMQGIFGLIGDMPSLVGQLISFLPTWILQFISVCLGLAIAIGVVKLFIG